LVKSKVAQVNLKVAPHDRKTAQVNPKVARHDRKTAQVNPKALGTIEKLLR